MLSVSASGMAAQRTRLEVMVENMANSETTRTSGGGPYRAKEVIFESAEQTSPFASIFQQEMAGTVKVGEIMEDMTERLKPIYSRLASQTRTTTPHVCTTNRP